MKFYIASGLQNHEQVRSLAKLLKNSGWTHTYDWTSLLYDRTSNVSEKTTDIETLRHIGEQEYNGVKQADVVIILTPQGRGTHTEFGMAIALGNIIYLCHEDDTYFKCDDNTSAFYWLPEVKHLIGNTDYIAAQLLNACSHTHLKA